MRAGAPASRKRSLLDATTTGLAVRVAVPSASDDPARQFVWWRARMLGGRTNHWGRISLRNGPYDFKPHTRDGLGFDWPIGYEDLAPYYDKVEMLIGVYGANDGLENTPNSSPDVLLPPPKPKVSDLLIHPRARKSASRCCRLSRGLTRFWITNGCPSSAPGQ